MNARALVVTSNVKDFELARIRLGLPVFKPAEFLSLIMDRAEGINP